MPKNDRGLHLTRWRLALAIPALCCFTAGIAGSQPLTFTHLAGSPAGAGSYDGTGTNARFSAPSGVAADGSGNAFVADFWNHTIRRVTAAGAVTTLAGSPGESGSADGSASTARFNRPAGIALDASGNLYVADYYNSTIRRLSVSGSVTTFAGMAGSSGSADGMASFARFHRPQGLAVDGSGHVLVADTGNHTIRRITPQGLVTLFAGLPGSVGTADGLGTTARFNRPTSLAVDPTGNVYVADAGNNAIRKITPGGAVSTLAGVAGQPGSQDGFGATARFWEPMGISADQSGVLFVVEGVNRTLRSVTAAGQVSTVAGSAQLSGSDDGQGAAARFSYPLGVAVSGPGRGYITDNHTIRAFTSAGLVSTLAGTPALQGSVDGTGSSARFTSPSAIAVDAAHNLFLADSFTIRRIGVNGVVTTLAGSPGQPGSADGTGSAARFSTLGGIVADRPGNLFVADRANNVIRKISPAGEVTTVAGLAGQPGSADGVGTGARFFAPTDVGVDDDGNLLVLDAGNFTIRRVAPGGAVTTLAGMAGAAGTADGIGSAARFDSLTALAVTSTGESFIYESRTALLRKVSRDGAVTTMADLTWPGFDSRIAASGGLALDSDGGILITDSQSGVVRRWTATGGIETLAGSLGRRGSEDGIGTHARFNLPSDLAVGSDGVVYVADTQNYAVRKGTPIATTCTYDGTSLCLLAGRFRVQAGYRDYSGRRGLGRAVTLSSDTGYFWFFDAANVEVVSKAVSFCADASHNVGIYTGGLTDLEVTLGVTDTLKGTYTEHSNLLGMPFSLIRDGSFGCAPGQRPQPPQALGPDAHHKEAALSDTAPLTYSFDKRPFDADRQAAALAAANCSDDDFTACLHDNRFRVQVSYRDYSGATGTAHAVRLTYDTAYFWFFDAANVEAVVKLVDFCGAPSPSHAVYIGGMTDVEVHIAVLDTKSGLYREYVNPLGTAFTLLRDGPFPCP